MQHDAAVALSEVETLLLFINLALACHFRESHVSNHALWILIAFRSSWSLGLSY